MQSVDADTLAADWRRAGIEAGDTVLVHSSIKRTAQRLALDDKAQTGQAILDSFARAVGPQGTLLFPLFNFEFTQGVPFDIRSTPSRMGLLSESARLHPQAVRTGHPIYSFAVLGARRAEFERVDNVSGYGPDSPFAMLRAMGGRIAVLDLPDQDSMTFYHHVEEMKGVDYRYHKEFEGDYTDARGVTTRRVYTLYVRDIERGVQTRVDPMGELLWEQGLYSGERPGEGAGLRVIAAAPMFDAVAAVIDAGRAEGLLYAIEPGP